MIPAHADASFALEKNTLMAKLIKIVEIPEQRMSIEH